MTHVRIHSKNKDRKGKKKDYLFDLSDWKVEIRKGKIAPGHDPFFIDVISLYSGEWNFGSRNLEPPYISFEEVTP